MNQLVFIKNNRPITNSLTVAEAFEKEHARVMRDIRDLECSEKFRLGNFAESSYTNQQGRKMPKIDMTEQGFTLLAMGYTGSRAMEFKERYIAEFHRMREQLNEPKTQLEILQASIAQLVEQERRLSEVENRMTMTEKKLDNTAELIALHPVEWRRKVTDILNKIVQVRGGYAEAYREVRNESYQMLEERAACNLSIRLTNRKRKMSLEGAAKSKVDKTNRLDVIADDARLTEIYLACVKEMAIRYQVSSDETIKNPK